MPSALHEHNNTIFHEMMSHPALFTHPNPHKVMIFEGENNNILQEVIKHDSLSEIIQISQYEPAVNATEAKVKFYSSLATDWLEKTTPYSIDILIHAGPPTHELLQAFFTLLHPEGILIQQSNSPFEVTAVKTLTTQLQRVGFNTSQILNFPQPSFSSGWRSIIMALKQGNFKRVREKAIYARHFKTYYYNLDTHKASLVLPEFMREEGVI